MRREGLVLVVALLGCGRTKDQSADSSGPAEGDGPGSNGADPDADDSTFADASDGGGSDGPSDAHDVEVSLPPSCAGATTPPSSLVCTGLYSDIVAKTIAPGIEAYAPAVPLWSDGASKQRWILLPAGTKIDTTNADEWVFPVGTKVWKEFSQDGNRVETRLWQKVTATFWVDATYAWNGDESVATRSAGGDMPWGTGTYHIPTSDECQKCHRGRTDRILGFEQVLLGLAGAQGMTLGRLAAEGRLTSPPKSTTLLIGDDGTGLAAPALAWMHVNCGTTCHNRNSTATAWATGMFLRLDPTALDGRSVADFDALKTTIGVTETSPNWPGRTRIVPHDPAKSLLYQLISHRGTGNQMPPIATSLVDVADIPLVEAWIEQLPVKTIAVDAAAHDAPGADGGVGDGEAPRDAAVSDGEDAPVETRALDADAAVSDAGVDDAATDATPDVAPESTDALVDAADEET
jgi:hypothetical protein